MIYLVHGEDLSYTRKIISNQQKKVGALKRIELDISDISPAQLFDLSVSSDLFGEAPFIVLNISGAGKAFLEEFTSVLEKIPETTNLILLSTKDLPKTHPFLSNAPKLQIKVVYKQKEVNSNIFRFVDSIFSGSREAAYKELKKLLGEDHDPFYLFSMVLFGLRKNKNKFSKERYIKLFNEIYEIEKSVKTGLISPDVMIPYTIEKIKNAQTV